jgi:hypothetical protein
MGGKKKFGGGGRGMWMSHEVFFLGIFMFYFWPIIKMFMLRIFLKKLEKFTRKMVQGWKITKQKLGISKKRVYLG